MKLVTVKEMQAIEAQADASGFTYDQMMETAGHNLAREVQKLSYDQSNEEIQVLGLVGAGKNGGDTLIALEHLAEKGWKSRAYLVNRDPVSDALVKQLENVDGEIFLAEKDSDFSQLQAFIGSADVLLDGLMGTGFKPPLKGIAGDVLSISRKTIDESEWPPLVVAVDCPSGVDCETGETSPNCIKADVTVTMAAIKTGLLKTPAFDYAGEIRVANIGPIETLSTWIAVQNEVVDEEMISRALVARPSDAHKGTFGTALIASGSINYSGACLLAGLAAYRAGAGLVTLAVPAPLHAVLAGQIPEATWILLPHEMGVIASDAADVLFRNIERATALLIGPGLGLEETTKGFLENLLTRATKPHINRGQMGFIPKGEKKSEKAEPVIPPLVLDADGLKLISKIPDWYNLLPTLTILTPHPGEMSIMTGISIDDIQSDRLNIASRFAKEWGHVIVLKGAFTVIASPDGNTTTIPVATSALARAGTGDVLAGLITGLRAQGMDAYRSAVVGAWIHAQAGLRAADILGSKVSILAGDILEAIPDVLGQLEYQV